MKYIALEEAFSIPDLDRQPFARSDSRRVQRLVEEWSRKLPDFMRSRLDSRYLTLEPGPRCSACRRPTSDPAW